MTQRLHIEIEYRDGYDEEDVNVTVDALRPLIRREILPKVSEHVIIKMWGQGTRYYWQGERGADR